MLPFIINRDTDVTLTEQIEVGFRRSIQNGHFREGDTLPTLQETAEALNVSMAVVRTAIRHLSQDGLVTARPKQGIRVAPAGQHRWLAHVLYLHWGSANSFYEAVLSETVMNQLMLKRILVTPVYVPGSHMKVGAPRLQAAIQSGPVDLAVLNCGAAHFDVFLAQNEIPFIHVTGALTGAPTRLARRTLMEDPRLAQEQAVRHAVACGVRSLTIVAHEGDGGSMKGLAEAAGLSVRVLVAKLIEGLGSPEAVERGGLEAMAHWLGSGEPLPDLIYFDDDYTARGGLWALQSRGIRIPEDVQVISWANRSLGPVFPKPLTRIEMDPERDGEALANLVEEALKKPDKKVKEPVVIGPEFVVGGTTRSVVG